MNALRPKQFVHRGSVEAAGFVVQDRARVLALWTRGTTVLQHGDRYVVLRPKPVRIRAELAPGIPLVVQQGVLVSASLEAKTLEELAAPAGSIVLVRHGELEQWPRPPAVDPSEWLDLSGFRALEPTPLGDPPPPPVLATPPPKTDARELTGTLIARPPAEQAEVVKAILGGKGPTARPAWWKRLFVRAMRWLLTEPAPTRQALPAPTKPAPPSWFERARNWLARLAAQSRLAEYFSRKHAEYLAKLLQMFDEGDLDAALRHAIPLDSGPGSADPAPALLPPKPREKLEIGSGETGTARSVGLGGGLFDVLREKYRAAIERLVRAGRIEDAAFVYVELLKQPAEAVALLEKHGRLKLAAEVAESRGLEPGLVVRQWWLAGEKERAIAIARRTGAFADAVARLERSKPEEAAALKLAWADSLAAAGDYATAVNLVWALEGEAARARKLAWLDRAIELGGPAAARLMPRMITLIPETFPRIKALAMPVLASEEPEGRREREAFATGLLMVYAQATGPAQEGLQALARPAARAMLRDGRSDMVERVVKTTGDLLLRADLPPPEPLRVESLATRKSLLVHVVDAADAGARAVHDALMLPDGKVLAALGEAGAVLVNRDGREVARFDRPAHGFVASEHGDKAIAIALRGERQMLSRIDLFSRRSEPWCDTELALVARRSVNGLVYAFVKDRLVALDATAADAKILWHVPDIQRPLALAAGPEHLQFVRLEAEMAGTQPKITFERWAYELPRHVLRDRRTQKAGIQRYPTQIAVSEQGIVAWTMPFQRPDGELVSTLHAEPPGREVEGTTLPGVPLQVAVASAWLAAASLREGGVHVSLMLVPSLAPRAAFQLEGAKTARMRLDEHHLVVADDRGRVVVLDLASGRIVRDLRT